MDAWKKPSGKHCSEEPAFLPKKPHAILYLSYDGMLEPLGYSQVFQYLKKFSELGHKVFLVSFEKPSLWKQSAQKTKLKEEMEIAGIHWTPLRYHKWPSMPATLWDVIQGIRVSMLLAIKHKINIVHARGYVTALMALFLKKTIPVFFVFDMRGFWPEEKVDAGSWKKGSAIFKITKWFEKKFLFHADWVVVLTRSAEKILQDSRKTENSLPLKAKVISTCVNLSTFQPAHTAPQNFVLGYVGGVTGWYRFEPAVRAFLLLKKSLPTAKFLILNQDAHEFIWNTLKKYNVPKDSVEIQSVQPKEIPGWYEKMTAGVFFIEPSFSKKASAPTKLGEFLACGLPCLTNTGVGDSDSILKEEGVGILIAEDSDGALEKGVQELIKLASSKNLHQRCVETAERHFSLEKGVASYLEIYNESIKTKILFLHRYGRLAASFRARFEQYFAQFKKEGFSVEVNSLIDNKTLKSQLYGQKTSWLSTLKMYWQRLRKLSTCHPQLSIVYIELFPFLPAQVELFLLRKTPFILDIDDAVFIKYKNHPNPLVRFFLENKIESLAARAQSITAGSPYLVEHLKKHNQQTIWLPTAVDTKIYPIKTHWGTPPIIGWIGSPSTAMYLKGIEASLIRYAQVSKTKILIIGAGKYRPIPELFAEYRDWSEQNELRDILDIDVGIMPLAQDEWSQGKCSYKLIQYMACGLPVIASAVGMNNEVVEHGRSGFLCKNLSEWEQSFDRALKMPTQELDIFGKHGRTIVERKFSLHTNTDTLIQLINRSY